MDSSTNFKKGENLNIAICPLCGAPNQCALADYPNATECWCDSVVFPEGLLAQIPEVADRKTCVCLSCLVKFYNKVNHL